MNNKIKILLVDDAGFIHIRLKTFFNSFEDVELISARSGQEAYEKYKESKPDMVFMDISMPDVDGIDTTKKIKDEFPDAKICMLTAMGQETMVKKSLAVGANDFIIKPFDKNRLIETIEKLTNKQLSAPT